MRVSATAKFVHTPARKLQVVGGMVRGRSASDAAIVLGATPRRAAVLLNKVLASAVANAVNNHSLKRADLVVESVLIGPGPTLKRFRPRSKGMAAPIKHRSSHITVTVTDQATAATSAAKPTKPKAAKPDPKPEAKKAVKPKAKPKTAPKESK